MEKLKELMSENISNEEHHTLMHLLTGGLDRYKQALSLIEGMGIEKVFDIGCAFGHQSELFRKRGIEYVGVNDGNLNFYNEHLHTYIEGEYPNVVLNTNQHDIAVSILCLTWNVYGCIETVRKQLKKLSDDFSRVIIYAQNNRVHLFNDYFAKVEDMGGGFIYASNQWVTT